MSDLSANIQTAASSPAEASVDGTTVKQRPISELIEADRYLASKTAASSKFRGLRFNTITPPGST